MSRDGTAVLLGLDAVIVSVHDESPRVLTLAGDAAPSLPSGPFDPARDRTLELAARRLIDEQTALRVGYLEQLYTFGDRNRDPREVAGGPRLVSVGYLALAGERAAEETAAVAWRDWYAFFPWEDDRAGRAPVLVERVLPFVARRLAGRRDPGLTQRARIAFGLEGAAWNTDAVLERFELLFELGGVAEAPDHAETFGAPMAVDHRRILATAIGRLRGKIKYRPIVFELLGPSFTLTELQGTVEALAGTRLHGPNFRRLVADTGIVEPTGERRPTTGRPASLYRFRPDVLAERTDSGVGVRRK
ncbi:MAG TPA: hypothetical protein VMD91_12530 [Candidatus Sulfotelmatobacter sp.]|nr:hypothetical protein [Candidatus Sulfotelmatobacter sp.]